MSKDLALDQTIWDVHENQESFIPLEFTEEIKPEIFGLEVAKATEMVSGLSVAIAERKVLENAYVDVIELPITTETLPVFKELRLKIVKNRTQGIEKWHKNNKAFYLAGGRFVDAVKNKEVAINEEMEAKLMEAEKFFENQQKAIAKELNDTRILKLAPYVDDTTGLTFVEFSDEDFDDYVLGKKTKFENAKKEADAEALRIENERLKTIETNRRQLAIAPYLQFSENKEISEVSLEDFETLLSECQDAKIEFDKEQEKIKAENNRLKAEADAKEKALEKERADAKAKADSIQKENERLLDIEKAKVDKILADAKAKADAEAEKLEAERIEKLNLELAPIRFQLQEWVNTFSIEIPKSLEKDETANEILSKFWAFKSWSNNQIKSL